MKKIISLVILGSLLSISVYAQLNVGGYASSIWTPYRVTVPEEGDVLETTAVQTPWGEPDLSAGMNFDGWSEFGGFHLGLGIANGAANRSAHAYSAKGDGWVWVKPLGFIPFLNLSSFTIWLGNPVDQSFMGKIGGSNLATYVLNNAYSINMDGNERDFRLEVQNPDYNTFTRINPYSWGNANQIHQNLWWPRIAAAAMITWSPIENLSLNLFVAPEMLRLIDWNADSAGVNNPRLENINGTNVKDADVDQDFYDVKEVYRKMQFAVGYDIKGLGFARVQWVGVRNVFEGAFMLTSLGDLILDIGFKIPFEGTEKDPNNVYLSNTYKRRNDFQASVAGTYRFYDLRLLARVDAAFAGSDSSGTVVKQRGLNLIGYVVPSYQLSVGMVGVDVGVEYEQKDDYNNWEEDSLMAGFALWFSRGMGNANFKVAAVCRLPTEWETVQQPFDLMFPILLSVGF